MEFIKSFPLLIILTLFLSSFIMPIIKKKKLSKVVGIISMLISTLLSVGLFLFIRFEAEYIYKIGHWEAPWGIEFRIGILESVIGLLFTSVTFIVLWYSLYNIDKEIKHNRISFFYMLVNILLGSLLGIIYSNDLFNCFVFIELSTLASCGIVVIKDKKVNIKAALKYLILSSMGSGLLLMAIAFIYSITGNLNITFINNELIGVYSHYPKTLMIILALTTMGLGVKSAMFPLHVWLPDAHSSAPTSSSALLSSVVLKAFVILLIKILHRVFGIEIISQYHILNLILLAGCAGMVAGSVLAILQKDLKRMIAYSSVAQMGYIFFGIGLGNTLGLVMAIFHIIGHAVTKSMLFLTAGAVIEQTKMREIDALKGVGKDLPILMGAFVLGAFSMVGIPILPGFISKWNLALASIQADKSLLVGILLMSSVLNAIYYLPIIINSYFGEENFKQIKYNLDRKPAKELVPILVLSILVLTSGLASGLIIDYIYKGLI